MAAPSPSLSAIILAGGHSRRMGQDKALLTTPGGQPLLSQTAQIAQQMTPDVTVVTAWPDRYQSILPSGVQLIREFANESANESASNALTAAPSAGPLSGFAQGWSQVQGDWCLLLACDLPYLKAAPLSQWWRWLLANPSTNPLAPPPANSLAPPIAPMASLAPGVKGWEPLCGYYHRHCLAALQHYLQVPANAHSFQAWLTMISVEPYFHLPSQMLFNCNTPQDWATVRQTPLS